MAGTEARTVLVVDDEAAIRLLCRVNLELDGYRVLEAATLADARGHLDAGGVDAVLLDLHLGREEGASLVRELGGRVPIALVTGSADLDTLELEGADAVLAKPFTIDDLNATVERLVENRR